MVWSVWGLVLGVAASVLGVMGRSRALSAVLGMAGLVVGFLALAWTSRGSQLFVATGTDVPTLSVMSFPQLSAFAPQTESLGRVYGSGKQWIGWTGTDAAHHLNLQWNFTDPATKTALDEMALGGPALAFHAQEQLAWTGTDSAHRLNIATFAAS